MPKEFDIATTGGLCIDLMLNPDYQIKNVGGITHLVLGSKEIMIPTDAVPTATQDKVTALEDLRKYLPQLDIRAVWTGGGGGNSTFGGVEIRKLFSNMGLSYISPTYPSIYLNGEVDGVIIGERDVNSDMKQKQVKTYFTSASKLNFNLVLFTPDGKRVIRNIQYPRDAWSREWWRIVDSVVDGADGVLLNSESPDVVSSIVTRKFDDNYKIYRQGKYDPKSVGKIFNSEEKFDNPDYTKCFTVVTPALIKDRSKLLTNIVPYSGLIFNSDDFLKLFYGPKAEDNGDESLPLIVNGLAALKYGFNTPQGLKFMGDAYNNVYVTRGKNGYIVATLENLDYDIDSDISKAKFVARDMRVDDWLVDHVNAYRTKNKTANVGAGDVAAIAMTTYETLGKALKVEETAAFVNTIVFRSLGIKDKMPLRSNISAVESWDLQAVYNSKDYKEIFLKY